MGDGAFSWSRCGTSPLIVAGLGNSCALASVLRCASVCSPVSIPQPGDLMLRSAGAIVLGFVLIGALAFGTDALLRELVPGAFASDGRIDSTEVLVFTQMYVGVFAIAGCYLAARLAPS